jgi:hypothetical protein
MLSYHKLYDLGRELPYGDNLEIDAEATASLRAMLRQPKVP